MTREVLPWWAPLDLGWVKLSWIERVTAKQSPYITDCMIARIHTSLLLYYHCNDWRRPPLHVACAPRHVLPSTLPFTLSCCCFFFFFFFLLYCSSSLTDISGRESDSLVKLISSAHDFVPWEQELVCCVQGYGNLFVAVKNKDNIMMNIPLTWSSFGFLKPTQKEELLVSWIVQ